MIERDPISGNEVPLGAEPHEVRDDIDAKLSDGEYVLPADVVRYFGVQYIEKLVEKAKAGMQQLHADGRVNGTPPVQAATGGPIMDPRHGQYQNTQPQNDPPQQMSAAEQMRKHQRPVNMDEGGLARRYPEIMNATPGFDASRWTYGKVSKDMVRTYVNDKGERLSIMFLNGVPLSEIPAGFYPADTAGQQQMAQQATVGTGEEVADPKDLGHDEDGRDSALSNGRVPFGQEDPNDRGEVDPSKNYYSATPDQLMSMYNEAKATADGGGLIDKLGNAPGIVGGIAKVASGITQGQAITKMEAIAQAAKERKLDIAPDLIADAETYAGNRTKGQEWFGGTVDGILKTHETGFRNMPYDVAVQNNPDLAVNGTPTSSPTGAPSYASEAPPPYGSEAPPPADQPTVAPSEDGSTFGRPNNTGQNPSTGYVPSEGMPSYADTAVSTLPNTYEAQALAGRNTRRPLDIDRMMPPSRTEAPPTRMPTDTFRLSSEELDAIRRYETSRTRVVDNDLLPGDTVSRQQIDDLRMSVGPQLPSTSTRSAAPEVSSRLDSRMTDGSDAEDRRAARADQIQRETGTSRAAAEAQARAEDIARNVSEEDRFGGVNLDAAFGMSGLAKGGLVSRPHMRRKSYRKIRTVER